MEGEREQRYLGILVEPIRVCAEYRPKLGRGREAGVSLADFLGRHAATLRQEVARVLETLLRAE